MKNFLDRFRKKADTVKILIGISKIALGGKGTKILDKIDKGTDFVDKGLEIAEMLKQLNKK